MEDKSFRIFCGEFYYISLQNIQYPIKYCDKFVEVWVNSKRFLHNNDKPALTNVWGDEAWFLNGFYHRINGPAKIYHDDNGNENYRWIINNKEISKEKQKMLNLWWKNKCKK